MKERIQKFEREFKRQEAELKKLKAEYEASKDKEFLGSGFKAGDWIVKKPQENHAQPLISRVNEVLKEGFVLTGLNHAGVWKDNYEGCVCDVKSIRKATSKEIEEALIKEAEGRGFKRGVKFKQYKKYRAATAKSNPYMDGGDLVVDEGFGKLWIYNDKGLGDFGEWAEIVEDTIEVNGYKAQFCWGYVKFGCAEIENSIFEELQGFIEAESPQSKGRRNRAVTAFKIGEGLFDIETIKKINERLK